VYLPLKRTGFELPIEGSSGLGGPVEYRKDARAANHPQLDGSDQQFNSRPPAKRLLNSPARACRSGRISFGTAL
jgi:hypothetical protein